MATKKISEFTAITGAEIAGGDLFPVVDVSAGAAGSKAITATELNTYLATNFYTKTVADASFAAIGHTHTFASLTSKPTDVAGYGITDVYTKTEADARYAALVHTHAAGDVTSGVFSTARLGTGTPAPGTYVDGGTGAWTTLPSGGGGASVLNDLTDVTIASPATGHILRHNGTNFVNALGSTYFATAVHTHDAADVTTGIISASRLGTGATARKFLRGDSTFAVPGPVYNVKDYGAVGDGSTNDRVAIQAAIDAITAAGGGRLHFEKGTYIVSGGALSLLEVRDIWVTGEGRYSTILRQTTANTPVIQCNGLWYSRFEGLRFETTASQVGNGVFECDGNYDGTHTLGVQGNTFKDCYFAGNASNVDYCFSMVRQGAGAGQGSENLFLNCHFEGAKLACYRQSGLNALNNTFIGGNFQAYPRHALEIAGGVNLYSVGFQSTYGYTQITNGGYDVDLSSSAGDRVIIDACRTESLRFCSAGFAYDVIIRGLNHTPSVSVWSSLGGGTLAVGTIVQGTTAAGNHKLYRVTTAGAKSGAEPTWPESGTVADGTITWTQTNFNVVTVVRGRLESSYIQLGQVGATNKSSIEDIAFTRRDPLSNSYLAGTDAPVTRNLYYEVSLSGAITPITFGTETALSKVAALNIGEGAIVAMSGNSNATYRPIALWRELGHSTTDSLNAWHVKGGWRFDNLTFADLTFATSANGVTAGTCWFITDGTPGDPLTGGGTGCFAYFANSRWVGVGTGGGGGASALNDLSDVTISSPATGHILRHNGTSFVNALGSTYFATATHTHDAADITTGLLVVARGGTGVGTFTSNGVVYGNGTSALQVTAQGAANSVLTANAGAPAFSATPRLDRLGLGQAADASAVLAATGQYFSTRVSGVAPASVNFNNGNCVQVQLVSGANTVTVANPKAGARYLLEVKQPASGAAGTVTWPSTFKWSGGTAPTLTTTNGRTDIVTLFYNGTNFGASALLDLAL